MSLEARVGDPTVTGTDRLDPRALPSDPDVLIVDDDEGPRRSLYLIFRNDYKVLLAASGAEALEIVQCHQIDAAILDIRMTGMSGIELLEKLKAVDPAMEAIMLTGYETIETIRQALRFGACDYLSKPFDLETIRATVANALRLLGRPGGGTPRSKDEPPVLALR